MVKTYKNKNKQNKSARNSNRIKTNNRQQVRKNNNRSSGHVKAPYPHFRYYKKSGHPALIVDEVNTDSYRYRKVMHGAKDGSRNNEMITPNPNPKDSEPMYIGRRKRVDKMTTFEDYPLPWKYPK